MQLTYVKALLIYAAVWMMVGMMLIFKGYGYSLEALQLSSIGEISELSETRLQVAEQTLLIILSLGFVAGYLKGKFVFTRVVKRFVQRLVEFKEPLEFRNVFSPRYALIVALMMGMGLVMRFSPLRYDVKAVIDYAVGIALMYGAGLFIRQALVFKRELPEDSKD